MLWLLTIAIPLLIFFFWWSWRKRQKLTAQFVQSRLLAHLTVGVSRSALKMRMGLLVLAVTLLLAALARPLWGEVAEEVRQRGLDIVIAIDTSRSMLAEDLAPNRLARAKLAALDLMRLAKHDRLGLVAFAGTAFLQCPLTLDEEAFRQSVNALEVGIIPQGGTALAEAIDASLGAFKETDENFKILVLFTDGEDNEQGGLEAAQKAARSGMRIFTVGVGTANGELLRVQDEQGRRDYVKDDQGNVVKSRLNESWLTQIATATEGFYLAMSGANTMDVLYRQGLAPLPRGETTTKMIRQHKEQYMWPLSLALVLLLLEMFWAERKRVERAAPLSVAPVNEELRKAVAALAVLFFVATATASPGSALREYERGHFDEAHREFEKLADKHPQDARLHYNAGAAAYQAQRYDEAANHFLSAINPENLPLQQNAYYNLGNAHFRIGEQQDNPQQKTEAWEQAVKGYESALKLDSQDADAQFNLALVKKKLEELRQQQQQSKEQNKDQSKDDKDEQKDKNQDQQQQKEDQEKQQPQEPKPEDKQQQNQKDEQNRPKQDKPEDQQESAQDKDKADDKDGPDDKNSSRAQNQPGQEQDGSTEAPATPGQMTNEQVQKLLDAARSEEKAMIFQPPEKTRNKARVFKDW